MGKESPRLKAFNERHTNIVRALHVELLEPQTKSRQ